MTEELMQFRVGELRTEVEFGTWNGEPHIFISQENEHREENDLVMIPLDVFRAIQSKLRIH